MKNVTLFRGVRQRNSQVYDDLVFSAGRGCGWKMLLVISNWKSWKLCEYKGMYLFQLPVGIPARSALSSLGLGVSAALAEELGLSRVPRTALCPEGWEWF